MKALGVVVLALVLVAELAALAAYGVWGWAHPPRVVLVWLLPAVGAVVWGLFAAPRARLGPDRVGPSVRPVVKVVFFGLAALALDDAGHAAPALVLLVGTAAVHALAALPAVRALTDEPDRRA